MRDEYDFSNAVRGRHSERMAKGVSITIHEDEEVSSGELREASFPPGGVGRFEQPSLVALDADVEAVFPNSASVNMALRMLIETAVRAQPVSTPREEFEKAG